jgi:outer membrane protease
MKKGRNFMQLINTKNKKAALLAAFFIITFSNSYSMAATSNEVFTADSNSRIPVSLSISTGILNGESEEYVYDGSSKLSKLTWELNNVQMVGVEASVGLTEKVSLNFGGWFNSDNGKGTMEDYDWRNGDDSPWTDYSESNSYVEEAMMLDANISYLLIKNKTYSLSTTAGFRHDKFRWNSYDGTGTYSFYDLSYLRAQDVELYGQNISYKQEYYVPYIGLDFKYYLSDKWEISSYIRGSLWAWGEDEDIHHNPAGKYTLNDNAPSSLAGAPPQYGDDWYDDYYSDQIENMAYLSLGMTLDYFLLENLIVTFSADFQKYFRETGNYSAKLYDDDLGYYINEEDSSGAGISNYSYMVSLGATYIF